MSYRHILLVDDHQSFRQGLASLINAQPDLKVVGQARDGFEALNLARDLRPHMIVMDINMPACDGLKATRLIRGTDAVSDIPVLILTIDVEEEILFEAIKAGANGYLLKSATATDILRAVRETLAGKAVLSPELTAHFMEEFVRLTNHPPASTADEDPSGLTPR